MRPHPPTTPGRRIARLGLAFLAALAIAGDVSAQEEEFRPAPLFEGTRLPDPPRQKEPWTPPETRLPRFLVAATATLFDQGLADPRGCEYRSIEITAGSVWGGRGAIASTNGWVLPAPDGREAAVRRRLERPGLPGRQARRAGRPRGRRPRAGGRRRGWPRRRRPEGPAAGRHPGLLGIRRLRHQQRRVRRPPDDPPPDQGLPAAPPRPGRPRRGALGGGHRPAAGGRPRQAEAEGRPDQLRDLLPDPGGRPRLVSLRPGRLRPHEGRRRHRPGRRQAPDLAPGGRRGQGRGDGLPPSPAARRQGSADALHRLPRPVARTARRPGAAGEGAETAGRPAPRGRQVGKDRRPDPRPRPGRRPPVGPAGRRQPGRVADRQGARSPRGTTPSSR